MRYVLGIAGLFLLWKAVDFGLSGSWPLAVIFFVLFGGVEFFVFALIPAHKPRKND